MRDEDYKTFLCSYRYGRDSWCFEIKAKSHREAEDRLKQMCWAVVDGEVMAKIPAPGFLARAAVAVRNFFTGRSS